MWEPTKRALKTNTGFIIAFNVTITSQLPDKAEHKANTITKIIWFLKAICTHIKYWERHLWQGFEPFFVKYGTLIITLRRNHAIVHQWWTYHHSWGWEDRQHLLKEPNYLAKRHHIWSFLMWKHCHVNAHEVVLEKLSHMQFIDVNRPSSGWGEW